MKSLQRMGRHGDSKESDILQERLALWYPHIYVSVQCTEFVRNIYNGNVVCIGKRY